MENKNVTTVDTTDVKTDDEVTTIDVEEYKLDRHKRSSLVKPGSVEKEKRKSSVAFNDEPVEIINTDTADDENAFEEHLEKKIKDEKRTKEQIIQKLRLNI